MKSLKARRWATDERSGVVSWRALMAGRSPELIEFYAHMVRRRLCLSTIDKRMSILARCEHALDHPLVKATTEELCDWLDGHKLQARTRCSYISHLSSFWKWATREEVALSNPTERLDRPILRHGLPRPVSPKDLALQLLRAHMYGCDVKASAHQLRHSYGTELYKRSGDLRMVQDLMGHSSPVTTAGYAAWDQNKASAIVATLFT